MRQKAVLVVLMLMLFAACADAAMPNPFRRRDRAKGGYFPEKGDIPDLVRTSPIVTYKREKFLEFYGQHGARYVQYGLLNLMSAEYTYGGKGRDITIEIATLEDPTSAAGLFHHHRGKVLAVPGRAVDVGAEGVVDSDRDDRNLYFYRSSIFVKIIYAGKEPVPDLTVIGRFIDGQLPKGRDMRPDGFAYIDVEGVNKESIGLTPGFTFNISFLPASVTASAPGGGSVASDMYILTRQLDRDAEQLFKDYTSYLKLYAEYIEEYKRGRQPFVKSIDPNQGRVVYTHYRNALIIAARPDGYDKGEVLIDRVMAKMNEVLPDQKKKGGVFGRRKGEEKEQEKEQEDEPEGE